MKCVEKSPFEMPVTLPFHLCIYLFRFLRQLQMKRGVRHTTISPRPGGKCSRFWYDSPSLTYFQWPIFSESEKTAPMGPIPGTSQNTNPFTLDAKTKYGQVQDSKRVCDAGKARSCPQVKCFSVLPDSGTCSFLDSCL